MKINERTLLHVANSSGTPSDKEGWLFKRGELNKTFQKRWTVLKGNLLYYFDKKGDREPIGVIILEGCRIELAEDELELFSFKIAFSGTSSRTYILGTDSHENMESWMKALSCASYDYLKMMVAELQRQLDETNHSEERRRARQRQSNEGVQTRQNPFDVELITNDLIDLGFTSNSSSTSGGPTYNQIVFTKRPFSEIHEHYGLKLRSYLEEQRNKHESSII